MEDLAVDELVNAADDRQGGATRQVGHAFRATRLDEAGELTERGVATIQGLRPAPKSS